MSSDLVLEGVDHAKRDGDARRSVGGQVEAVKERAAGRACDLAGSAGAETVVIKQ
jgi:hypothetical protein